MDGIVTPSNKEKENIAHFFLSGDNRMWACGHKI